MEGIYAARAVPLAGQLVDMAGLRVCLCLALHISLDREEVKR